jgi:hypothetical protein
MQKVRNLKKQQKVSESRLRDNLEAIDRIRTDTVDDIESLTETFQHMTLVTESVQKNYKALLTQNQLLKDTLLSIIDECDCGLGNRCDRCQRILQSLAGKNPEPKINAAQKYQSILTQIRNSG